MVRAWAEDGVSYAGDVVFCDGGTWQAKKDTAQKPPHKDWICLAAAGRDGRDAVMPTIVGTYRDGGIYCAFNIVALNGSSFIARKDNPGPCPGDGWQLIASAGKPGKPGQKGDQGAPGPRGERGPSVSVLGWKVDPADYSVTLVLSDGEIEPLRLRSLFEQFHIETR
ncbi:collagen-like protein [Bradyrhizobium sp. BRP22]|uniref:collagen-like triple helix repeat-containing protein n=1 Tax=Bradyrhizobium sp. BRP22 TaxID=2793821 RepID=UPI001CD27144|nr:collagen-like protein [Bradyrhizobium sp. BRP22]